MWYDPFHMLRNIVFCVTVFIYEFWRTGGKQEGELLCEYDRNDIVHLIDDLPNVKRSGYSLIIFQDMKHYVGDGAGLKAITNGDKVLIDP